MLLELDKFLQVAASYINLAGLLRSMNRLSEALPFARKALEVKIRTHPAKHPEVAAAQLALAELLKDLAQCVQPTSVPCNSFVFFWKG